MKYCAIATAVFILGGILSLIFFVKGEDIAGPVALGIYATFASIVVATVLAVFQKLLQNAVDIKSENDLTV
jgi:O-antigen/teichoic acid export membrane protein